MTAIQWLQKDMKSGEKTLKQAVDVLSYLADLPRLAAANLLLRP